MTAADVYPKGDQFPFIAYDVRASSAATPTQTDANAVAATGAFTVMHSYNHAGASPSLPAQADAANLRCLYPLGTTTTRSGWRGAELIDPVASSPAISWWDLCENVTPISAAFPVLSDYATQTRLSDGSQRPNYALISQYSPQSEIQALLKAEIDILGVQARCAYMFNASGFQKWYPNAWVRYRMEAAAAAIMAAGKTQGRQYLAGQKTLIGVVECGYQRASEGGRLPTAQSVTHNIWQSLCSGAKGVAIYSYLGRLDNPTGLSPAPMAAVWDAAVTAGALLQSAVAGIGQAILFGIVWTSRIVTITGGPATTDTFLPNQDPSRQYPSIDARVLVHRDSVYIIAVNSAETATVNFEISNLPSGIATGKDLISGALIALTGSRLVASLPALGVAVYKLRRTQRYSSRFYAVIAAADKPTAATIATYDLDEHCDETLTYNLKLGTNNTTTTHWGCDVAAENANISTWKTRTAQLPSLKWFEVSNESRVLLATNVTAAQVDVGLVISFDQALSRLGLVKVTA